MRRTIVVVTVAAALVGSGAFVHAETKKFIPYHGLILAEKSAYPPETFGTFLEACNPARDGDKERRRNNDAYCAGFLNGLLEGARAWGKACPNGHEAGYANLLALAIAYDTKTNKRERSIRTSAVLSGVFAETYPCK